MGRSRSRSRSRSRERHKNRNRSRSDSRDRHRSRRPRSRSYSPHHEESNSCLLLHAFVIFIHCMHILKQGSIKKTSSRSFDQGQQMGVLPQKGKAINSVKNTLTIAGKKGNKFAQLVCPQLGLVLLSVWTGIVTKSFLIIITTCFTILLYFRPESLADLFGGGKKQKKKKVRDSSSSGDDSSEPEKKKKKKKSKKKSEKKKKVLSSKQFSGFKIWNNLFARRRNTRRNLKGRSLGNMKLHLPILIALQKKRNGLKNQVWYFGGLLFTLLMAYCL